jgi:hypothetical protein
MEALLGIMTAFGLSSSAGLNAYIPLLIVALLAKFTNTITLDTPWNALESWWIIGLLLILALVEFFADKFPAVNHANDIIQSFIRPAAGAIAFAASTSHSIKDISPVLALALGLLIAGSVHATKSLAVRPAVTATTAGAGNIAVSAAEDTFATIVSFVAVIAPILVAVILVLTAVLIIYWLYRRSQKYAKVKYKPPRSDSKL